MDLEIEHENKIFKNDCYSYHGEITDKTITRVSRSTEASEAITNNFDKCTKVKRASGKHTEMTTQGDVLMIVEQLKQVDVYKNIPGRFYTAYPSMRHNLLDQIDTDKYKAWISKSIKNQ